MATKKMARKTTRRHVKAQATKAKRKPPKARTDPATRAEGKPEGPKRSAVRARPAGKKAASGGRGVKAAAAPNAISLLESDHALVRKLFAQIEATNAAKRQTELLQRIEHELKLHTHVEEQIFYPAFRERARKNPDLKLYYEALEEHHAVDVVLPEVKDATPGTPQFAARAKVLKELVEHHADEEEREMFPRARSLLDDAALRKLGHRIAEEKESAGSSMLEKMASLLGMS